MGAGILPTTIHNGKLYFLFGKENKFEDSAPGFSDFGGGTDYSETYLETAVREGAEELTGFLGNPKDIKKLLKKNGTYNIDYNTNGHKLYRMHIFPMNYDPMLAFYYNNNQRFLQQKKHVERFERENIFCIHLQFSLLIFCRWRLRPTRFFGKNVFDSNVFG